MKSRKIVYHSTLLIFGPKNNKSNQQTMLQWKWMKLKWIMSTYHFQVLNYIQHYSLFMTYENDFGTKYFLYDVSKPHLSLIMVNKVASDYNQSTAHKRPSCSFWTFK